MPTAPDAEAEFSVEEARAQIRDFFNAIDNFPQNETTPAQAQTLQPQTQTKTQHA